MKGVKSLVSVPSCSLVKIVASSASISLSLGGPSCPKHIDDITSL